MEYSSREEAFTIGFKWIIRSPDYFDISVDEELRRGRVVADALEAGVDPRWVRRMLAFKAFRWIETEVKRRCQ